MSKYQEALDKIKSRLPFTTWLIHDGEHFKEPRKCYEDKIQIDLLQELVDKATPKKPTILDKYDSIGVCPNCKNYRIYDYEDDVQFKYCAECGQALDWNKDEQ